MCDGYPCGIEVMKVVLLFLGVSCYLVYCDVIKLVNFIIMDHWFCTGLSSSELVNTKWWCTGLWFLHLCGEYS